MAKHLAVFVGDAVEKILKGEKTVELRLALSKIAPYGQIKKEDAILLKESGDKVLGQVSVDNVLFYENLDGEMIGRLRKEYTTETGLPDEFWQRKANARYASIIFLKNPRRFLTPLKIKKKNRRPWIILEKD